MTVVFFLVGSGTWFDVGVWIGKAVCELECPSNLGIGMMAWGLSMTFQRDGTVLSRSQRGWLFPSVYPPQP